MSNRQIARQDYQLVNSRYKLTANETKLILNAISEIQMHDEAFHPYRIRVTDISEELGRKQNHSRLKEFCEGIFKKPVHIPKERGGWLICNWFSSIEYLAGSGEIQYKISDELKPYLLDLKQRFVKTNLRHILPMTSEYAIRIYQLIKERQKLGERSFDLAELQDQLQVPKSLHVYADFKRKVLNVARKQINQYTDLEITEIREIKRGRKVVEIVLSFAHNPRNVELADLQQIYHGLAVIDPKTEELYEIRDIVYYDGGNIHYDAKHLETKEYKRFTIKMETFWFLLDMGESRSGRGWRVLDDDGNAVPMH